MEHWFSVEILEPTLRMTTRHVRNPGSNLEDPVGIREVRQKATKKHGWGGWFKRGEGDHLMGIRPAVGTIPWMLSPGLAHGNVSLNPGDSPMSDLSPLQMGKLNHLPVSHTQESTQGCEGAIRGGRGIWIGG